MEEERDISDFRFECLTESMVREKKPIRERKPWISEATWKLVDKRGQRLRAGASSEDVAPLNHHIRRSLKLDRKQRVEAAGAAIEAALESDELQEAWNLAKAWYKTASGKAPKPSRHDFEELHRERTALYAAAPSPGAPIPIHLETPFVINDAPPTPDEVAEACMELKRNRACGPSGMRNEDLRRWLANYRKRDATETDKEPWLHVLEIVDSAFRDGELPKALTLSLLVIIPKPCGGVRGIGLLESIWKLAHGITFHDSLHGFRKKRGCGTAILECRLEQERALYKGETLFQVFLDLTKAYDTLDRERTLLIMEQYGVGPNIIRLLKMFWNDLELCSRQGGYYGRTLIQSERGVTQGGITSPIIFNIVGDAIVRELLTHFSPEQLTSSFYADDGRLASICARALQRACEMVTDLFGRVGMKVNPIKTKAMVGHNGNLRLQLSSPAYKRRMDGTGDSYREAKRRKVDCPVCHQELQAASLARHLHSRHGDSHRPYKRRKLLEEADCAPVRYFAYSPTRRGFIRCPVSVCPATVSTRDALRMHFSHRHWRDEIHILPGTCYPRCPRCNVQAHPSRQHFNSRRCQSGRARKRKRELEIEHLRALSTEFRIDDTLLENVETFRYLGRIVSATTEDWPSVSDNLRKARKSWGRFSTLLRREGASPRVCGLFYKAVVLSTLLYACETWVITKPILRALEGFHNRITRCIARLSPRYHAEQDAWEYLDIELARSRAGVYPLQRYLERRRRYLDRYARDRPLLLDCVAMDNLEQPSTPRRRYWWNSIELDDGASPAPSLGSSSPG